MKDGGSRAPQAAAAAEPSAGGDAHEFVLPASSAQERLWFIDGLRPESPAYDIPAVFELLGPLDIRALERGVDALVARHEALRTVFREAADGLQQIIRPTAAGSVFTLEDLTGVTGEQRTRERERIVGDFVRRVFDLSAGPLVDVRVVRWQRAEHTLLVNVHHTIADGWSLAVLLRELSVLYAAATGGAAPVLPPLALQYADYTVWQQERLQAGGFDAQLEYWRQALAGAPQTLDLPTDRPRPAVKTFAGAAEWLDLTTEELAAVRRCARELRATPFQVLLAASAVVLGRYSRQEEVLLGTPMADRTHPDTESLVGFLVNTVVLRADLAGDPTVAELVDRLRATVAGATENQELPFDRVVEALNPDRDLSRTPVFQVMVTYQADPLEALRLPGIEATSIPTHNGTAKFDLLLGFEEHGGGLRVTFEYSTDLFAADTIQRMSGHFRTVLAALVTNRECRVGALPMLTAEERAQIVVAWNETKTGRREDTAIHQFFLAQASRTPDATAIRSGHQVITYRELRARTGRLAAHLRSLGVAPGSLVGVCLERSPDLIAAVLAVLEAGGAYVPLDPGYPQERLRFVLEDTDASVVLTSAAARDALPPSRGRLVDVAAALAASDHVGDDLSVAVGPDDLAYVIYTSGSTGRPKGVALEHRVAAAMIRWARSAFDDADLAGVLAATSICFDLSVFELFVPLSWGGAVVLAGSALDLPRLPAAAAVSLINTVPSAIAELLRMGGLPAGLRVAILAGERLRPALVDEILTQSTIRRVIDVYGPSETSYTTAAERRVGSPETIGRPLPEVQTYVLDARRNPVPIGVPGELYIGGGTVARGYLHRSELTRQRFLDHPFDAGAGRVYASGDLARWRPDGTLEYLGRTDHQVKVRGYRIEPGEIEVALRRHPDVADAVVVVREDVPGDQRLVAYVVTSSRPDDTSRELRRWLQGQVPEFMVPSSFVPLDALPQTPNGKVDRRALPAPAGAAPAGHVAPRTDIERRVARIWAGVLSPARAVGVDDNFFALGGHSLLAVRLFTGIQSEFGVTLPLSSLFEAPTVAGLSALLDAALSPARDGAQRDIPHGPTADAPGTAGNPRARLPLDVIRRSTCLAAVQPLGHRPPLFVLPGVGGNILGFRAVARHLDPDQPVVGLESVGRSGQELPLTNFKEIAARFIVEMRSLQPDGPYAIAGISFGGLVAFEMAQQLRASGQRVVLLALVDTGLPPLVGERDGATLLTKVGDLGRRLQRGAGALLTGSEGGRTRYLRARVRRVRARLERRRWQRRQEFATIAERLGAGQRIGLVQALRNVRQANLNAYYDYRPAPYDGEVTLFHATERDDPENNVARWHRLTAALNVRPVPGNHSSMLEEPNVAALAAALSAALDAAFRRPPPG
ncbi:MAG: amino acid adenylation domain-containing protein [Vicinamibacterales bacterium]